MGVLKDGTPSVWTVILWRVAGGVASGGRLRLPVPNPSRSKDCAPVLVGIRSAMYVRHGAIPVGWADDMTHQNNAHVHDILVTDAAKKTNWTKNERELCTT